MSKVTVKDSPAELAATEESNVVIDAKGRRIVLRELSPVQEGRLFLAVGPENSENTRYMTMYAFPAAMFESIDGEPYSVPTNMAQVESNLAVLGHDGLNALRNNMIEAMKKAQADLQKSEEQAAKN